MAQSPYLDANGTDGSDPSLIDKVYPDGTRIRMNDSAAITARDALESEQTTRRTETNTRFQQLASGLNGLSVEDRSYAIAARIMAYKEGATNAVILAIATKAQAQAYVMGLTKWTNVPASTRPMLATMLETLAGFAQVMMLVLE